MLSRFHHILVPVDIAGGDTRAVDIACDLAVEHHARVTLLHVIQAIGDDPPDDEAQRFYNHLRQRVGRALDKIAERFRGAGIDTVTHNPVGDALREIAAYGNNQDVDLIVMTSHRVDSGNLAASWGTLSYRVSVVCDAPILLVK